jgi:hypothetical protein
MTNCLRKRSQAPVAQQQNNKKTVTVPSAPDSHASPPVRDAILDAARYLDQCLRDHRPFGIVLSQSHPFLVGTVDEFLRALRAGVRAVRLPAPTDSAHTFLEAILLNLGFEPFEASVDDLQRLLLVVFRQARQDGGHCVVVLDQAQNFGPRVFEAIRDLVRSMAGSEAEPLFVLTGGPGLARVLDSRGMANVANLTRQRHVAGLTADLPASAGAAASPLPETPAAPAAVAAGAAGVYLIVTLDDRELVRVPVEHDRVLIGRSKHNDVVLPSRFVSRHHAMIIASAEGPVLMDLKSTNGTYVNSRAVRARMLHDGDWISVGNYRLRFEDPRPRPAVSTDATDLEASGETIVMRSLHGIAPVREQDDWPALPGAAPAA